jgi:dephospho-CoA kinase
MITRPFTRLVVAFGQRRVPPRRLVEESILGFLILIPFGFVVGFLTSRLCTKIKIKNIRSDIWTTIVVFFIGDILMEWLLPSLSCLPVVERKDEYYYTVSWLLQSYGMYCPPDFPSSTTLLSPDATAILFSLRLVFLCLGVHIGESLCFVALTGGIATGKSTVSQLLVEYNYTNTAPTSTSNKRKPKKAASNNKDGRDSQNGDDYKEGTVNLICADSIAHEILLPPSVLANESEEDEDEDTKTVYTVQAKDSVYNQLVATFEGHDILSQDGKIDRLKMGSIIFKDPQKRRKLNQITHPKIFAVLLQTLLRGVFFSSLDIAVADIPLLFESGKLSWLFAITVCVVTDPKTQLERLKKRNPELSKQECQERIDSQLPLSTKQKMADIVIENSGNLDDLSEQVEEVRRDIMGRLYGIGMSLLQMLLLIGGSTSIAVSSKFYSHLQQ